MHNVQNLKCLILALQEVGNDDEMDYIQFQLVRLGNHQFLIVLTIYPAILGELSKEPQNPQNHRVAMDFTPWFLDPLPLLNPAPTPKKTNNSRKRYPPREGHGRCVCQILCRRLYPRTYAGYIPVGEEDGLKMYEHYMFFATWRFNIYKTEKQLMGNRNVVFETTQSLKIRAM